MFHRRGKFRFDGSYKVGETASHTETAEQNRPTCDLNFPRKIYQQRPLARLPSFPPAAHRVESIKMQLVLFEAATCGGGSDPAPFGRDGAFGEVIYIWPDCV